MPKLRSCAGPVLVLIAAASIALPACGVSRGPNGATTASAFLPAEAPLPSDPRHLAALVDRAQAAIDDPSSTTGELAGAALVEQRAGRAVVGQTRGERRATLGLLTPRARSSTTTNLAAAAALSVLATRPRDLPRWRIVAPTPPATLRAYLEEAQARTGMPWQYLAAIELIETGFGRVDGVSTAGAQGPMQFLPATWARYGAGSIRDPRDAILGAARYLVASGAPRHMATALYAYNHSLGYVRAVEDYAGWMRADPRAYYGYYYWQVVYDRRGGAVILPLGYPRRRPVALGR